MPEPITQQFSLAGQRAIVTGAGRGIGRAIATGLTSAGASVALVARSRDELNRTRAEIVSAGGAADALAADLADTSAVGQIADRAEKLLGGKIDIVVHSAGTQHREPAITFPLSDWNRVIAVNLTAPFLLSQELGRRQLADNRPGSHIFVASLTSVLGLPNLVAYNAAKSGLMGVVRALSREWAVSGIRVNGISPGYVETEMTRELLANPAERRHLTSRIPMGRLGVPEELAAPSVFLASAAARYITGQLLIVDGGWAAA